MNVTSSVSFLIRSWALIRSYGRLLGHTRRFRGLFGSFDGQKMLVGKSVLTSKMYGKRFPTVLMARNFCGKKCLDIKMFGKRFPTLLMARNVCGKKCLDIKNILEAISDTFDGKKFLWEKVS